MWVVKRREGSVNYIVTWAVIVLMLAIGLFCLFWAFLYYASNEASFIISNANIATALLAVGFILVFVSLFLSYRQVRLATRLRQLHKIMDNARSGLRLAESMGVDTERAEGLYRRADTQAGFSKLRDTERIMADCLAILESLLTLHTDKLLEKTRADMEEKRDSIGIGFSEGSLAPIQEDIEKGDYWNVSRLLRDHKIASERIEELVRAMRRAVGLGLQVGEERERLQTALDRFNEGNSSGARIEAIRARDVLYRRMRDFVKKSYVKPVFKKMELLSRRGVASEEAQRLLKDAGTHLLAADIEASVENASLSGERIDDEARAAIEDSMDKIDHMTARAELLGVDVTPFPPLIGVANENLNEGRLEESLDQLQTVETSLVQEMNSIVLEMFYSIRKDMDLLFLVPEAKLEFINALEEADEERKKGNFEEAIRLGEKLETRTEDEEKESQRLYERSLQKLHEKIGKLEVKGVPVQEVQEVVTVSDQLASDGDYAKAMEAILSATEIVDRNLSLHKDSIRTFEEVSTLLNRTRDKGVDIGDLWEELLRLQESSDLERVITQAKEIEEQALQRMTDTTERAHVKILKMRDQLDQLLKDGIDVGAVPDLLELAQQELDKEDFNAAQKTIERASEQIETAIDLSEGFEEAISKVREAFARLETAGVPTSVFESDLQNILSKKDEDSLENVYGLLDEVRAERKRMKRQARESIEESGTLIEENPDVDFGEERDILGRASEAFEEGKYGKAFEIGIEAVGRTQKKLELYEKSDQLLETLSEDLDGLEKAGFNIHSLESELQICEMEKDPSTRIDKIRALESEIAKTEKRLEQSMEWAIVEARHWIAILEKNKVSSDDLGEMIESAQELASDRVYREAQKKARNVRDLAEERVAQFKEARDRMGILESIMAKAEVMDISLEEFEEDFSWLKTSDDYSLMIEKAKLMYDKINNLLEGERENVRSAISSLKDSLVALEQSNVHAPAARSALERAEVELSKDDIIAAMGSCKSAEENLEEIRVSYDKWVEVMSNVEGYLEEASKTGIGIKDFVSRLDALKRTADYEYAASEADKILDDLDSRKTAMSTRTLEEIQKTREKVDALLEEGAQAGTLLDLLKEAERAVQDEEYVSARRQVIEAARTVEGLRSDYDEFTAVMDEAKTRVEQAAEFGLDTDEITGRLMRLTDSEEDYSSRIQLARELGERASTLGESTREEATRALEEAREILERLRSAGTNVKKAEKVFSNAEGKLAEGRLQEARRLALEARTIGEEMASLAEERTAETERARDMVKKAAASGVDVKAFSKEMDKAIVLKDDRRSVLRLRAIIEEAESSIASLDREASEELDRMREELIELRKSCARVASLKGLLESAESSINEGNLAEAEAQIQALREQESRIEELNSEYEETKKGFEDEISDLEAGREKLEVLQKEGEEAESLHDIEEAIQRYKGLTERAVELRKEMREKAEKRLEEVRDFVNELDSQGADIEEALSVLYEAEEVLDDGGFLRAMAKVNRAADLGDKISEKLSFDGKLLETEKLLEAVNEEGIDVSDLMEKLESLSEGTDYPEMTGELKSIEEEAVKRKNGNENTS
ncbi:MAG: hypothetical protein E3J35_07345 [Methanomassiliicoccales archaeon]|nr:MAG: hypothetical protein E3J35_07345 [Methanomassiliicoccales archaeon]